MAHPDVMKYMREMQRFRDQIIGLSLLPPDASAILEQIDNAKSIMKSLQDQEVTLQKEIADLNVQKKKVAANLDSERDSADREHQKLREETADLVKQRDAAHAEKRDVETQLGQVKAEVLVQRETMAKEKAEHEAALKKIEGEIEKLRKKIGA